MRRWIFAAASFLWLTPVLAVAAGGLGLSLGAALLGGAGAAAAIASAASRHLDRRLGAQAAQSTALAVALALAAALAIVRLATFSVFMADVNRPQFSVDPTDTFRLPHSCVSAYAEAARFLHEGGHNIYERDLYRPNNVARAIGPLQLDPFHYPPPFLLLPQALRQLAPDFWDFRRVWFALQALTLAVTLLGLAAWVGGRAGAVALLGGIIVLGLPHVIFSLQQGNFQITAVPLAVLSGVLIATRPIALGSGLLAFAAMAKIFPGVLLVPLVAARDWRRVAWVGGFGIGLLALTLLAQGFAPTRDFLSTSLPEISSGAAFPQTENPRHSRVNWSAYGQTVRLRQLGITWLTQSRGLMIAELYGVAVVALAAWAGFRRRFDLAEADERLSFLLVTVGLVGLASFRSPFVGAVYGCLATFWVMIILAARAASAKAAVGWIAGMIVLAACIWALPSPGQPLSTPWIWGSGLLLGFSMAVSAGGIVVAVRRHVTPGASARDGALAAASMPGVTVRG